MIFIPIQNFFNNKKINEEHIKKFKNVIESKSLIELHTHPVPDMDAIASLMIMKLILGDRSKIIIEKSKLKSFKYEGYNFDFHDISTSDKKNPVLILDTIKTISTAKNHNIILTTIDHHLFHPSDKNETNSIIILAPSTALVLYKLSEALNILKKLDREFIENLVYVSIAGDLPIYRERILEQNNKALELFNKFDEVLNQNLTLVHPAILSESRFGDWVIIKVEDNYDTGYVANKKIKEYNNRILVISKHKEYIKFSIRSFQETTLIFNALKEKIKDIQMGANLHMIGGRTKLKEQEFLRAFQDIALSFGSGKKIERMT